MRLVFGNIPRADMKCCPISPGANDRISKDQKGDVKGSRCCIDGRIVSDEDGLEISRNRGWMQISASPHRGSAY